MSRQLGRIADYISRTNREDNARQSARYFRAYDTYSRYMSNIFNSTRQANTQGMDNINRLLDRRYSRATYMGLRAANGSRG